MAEKSKLSNEVMQKIDRFIIDVKSRRAFSTSHAAADTHSIGIAENAACILRDVLTDATGFQQMIAHVKEACRRMQHAHPYGPLITNVARQILYIIREEHQIAVKNQHDKKLKEGERARLQEAKTFNPVLDAQLLSFTASSPEASDDAGPDFAPLQREILAHLKDAFMPKFDSKYKDIVRQAINHIADGEVIMTYGYSQAVEKFMLKAKEKVSFHLIICEGAPACEGHELARNLSVAKSKNIEITVIPDTLAYAYMSRVSKVVLGTHLMLANGGAVAIAGAHGVATAAHFHRVPVIVLSPLIKLTPIYPSTTDLTEFGRLKDPGEVLPFDLMSSAAAMHGAATRVEVLNASIDYIPPELIALFITDDDEGRAHAPGYVYRLINQLYHTEDTHI